MALTKTVAALLVVVGAVSFVVGVALISIPAGLMAGGILLAVAGLTLIEVE